MSPSFFVILVTLSSTFAHIFQDHTLFSANPTRCRKPLTHPIDPPEKKKKPLVSPFNQAAIFACRKLPQTCLIANLPTILFVDSHWIWTYFYQKTTKVTAATVMTHTLPRTDNYHTGLTEQRHLTTMSDSCPSKLDGDMLLSCCEIKLKQLNLNISMSLFL